MKKIFLTLLALTGILQHSNAQWTGTGTGIIYPLTLTDKVGIGHNAPATLLHILGASEQLRLGYNTSNYVSLTTNSSGALTFTRNGTAASTKSVAFAGSNGELAVISNNSTGSAFYVRGNGTADIVKVLDGTNPVFTVRDGGNVGIGTATPTDNLHIVSTNGGISISNTGHFGLRLYNVGDNTEKMHLYWRSSDDVIALNTGASPGRDLSFITGVAESIRIKASGNVGIGTSTPDAKLAVNGTIHSKQVLIDLNGWSDYVFKPEYKLPSLSDVKNYVSINQHLPDIPSEKELEKSGVDVTEMLKLQMKKIEELTLYLIEKDEKLKQQDDRIKKLENILLKEKNKK